MTRTPPETDERQLLDLYPQFAPAAPTAKPGGGKINNYGPSAAEFVRQLLDDEDAFLLTLTATD